MTKELRVVAIVFGSLMGLIVLSIAGILLAYTAFSKRLAASEGADPASFAPTVRKIATFDVPRGYVVENALDYGSSQWAELRPTNRKSQFRISMSGTLLPYLTASDGGVSKHILFDMQRTGGCTPAPSTTAAVTVRGEVHEMEITRCVSKQGWATRYGLVTFRGNVPTVRLMASGADGDFDDAAIRRLLASVR